MNVFELGYSRSTRVTSAGGSSGLGNKEEAKDPEGGGDPEAGLTPAERELIREMLADYLRRKQKKQIKKMIRKMVKKGALKA